MKKEIEYGVSYYDDNGEWCDGDNGYETVHEATNAAEQGLRAQPSRKTAHVERITKVAVRDITLRLVDIKS